MTTRTFKPSRVIQPIPEEARRRLKIQSTQERPRYAKVLLSGLGGQGKTAFIGTASKRVIIDGVESQPLSNLLVLEFDPDGDDTFFGMNVVADRVKPVNEQEVLEVLKWLVSSREPDQYDVIAIDPYNRMQDIEGDVVLRVGNALAQNPRQDKELLEIRDYGRLYKRCRDINDFLLAIRKHIIVTCILSFKDKPKDMDKKKENRGQVMSLALDGKMAHILSTQFSVHGIIEKVGSGPNTHTETEFSIYNSEAKTRFRMEQSITDMTFPILLHAMGIEDPSFHKITWIQDEKGFLPAYANINGRAS